MFVLELIAYKFKSGGGQSHTSWSYLLLEKKMRRTVGKTKFMGEADDPYPSLYVWNWVDCYDTSVKYMVMCGLPNVVGSKCDVNFHVWSEPMILAAFSIAFSSFP